MQPIGTFNKTTLLSKIKTILNSIQLIKLISKKYKINRKEK